MAKSVMIEDDISSLKNTIYKIMGENVNITDIKKNAETGVMEIDIELPIEDGIKE